MAAWSTSNGVRVGLGRPNPHQAGRSLGELETVTLSQSNQLHRVVLSMAGPSMRPNEAVASGSIPASGTTHSPLLSFLLQLPGLEKERGMERKRQRKEGSWVTILMLLIQI